MVFYKGTLLIFFLFLFTGCWEKQDNEVVAPEPALYSLDGDIVDMASGDLLTGIGVVMQEIQLTERSLDSTIHFGIKSIQTDQQGHFHFDSVYVGRYTLTFIRDGFTIHSQNFQQLYTARNEVFELPAAFTGGFVWTRDSNNLISFCHGDSLALSMSVEDQDIVIYREIDNYWSYLNNFNNPVTGSFDIEFGSDKETIWITYNAGGSQGATRMQFFPDSGWQTYPVQPEEPEGLLPVSVNFWNDSLYIADRNNLYTYTFPGLRLLEQVPVMEGLIINSMEKAGNEMWVFDKNTQYLYHTSSSLLIHKVYRVFMNGAVPHLNDFAIDFKGRFWFTLK